MKTLQGALVVVVLATLVASIAAIGRVHEGPSWSDVLRDRFVLGVPWGTLLVLAGVFAIYLFVQDGVSDFENPVTIPFRAWSYYYPLGIASASFAHAHNGHLLNNLLAAAVVAPIAEYAWGHYPNGRDGYETTSRWTTPWTRAVVVFPLAVVCVGLLTSAFALGPVIGFSGVVFAFAGFAIVRYPITTLVAVLGGQSALLTIYRALRWPIFEYTAQPSPPSPPSWATIAIQGHALGFFIGLVCGLFLLHRRAYRSDPLRIWIALLLFGFAQGLWAIYWFGGENTYILFRGPGVAIVLALALVITFAIVDTDRSLLPFRSSDADRSDRSLRRILDTGLPETGESIDRGDRIRSIALGSPLPDERFRFELPDRQKSAFVAVLLVLALITGPAIPFNLFVTEGRSTADDAVTVEDYTVFYDEGVENELVSFVDVSTVDQEADLEASGVIVTSEERHLWMEAVSAQRLEFTGSETIYVGGPGWREPVHVERQGWIPIGNSTVYHVEIWADGTNRKLAYESDSSRADVRIDDHNVTLASEDGEFRFEVESNDTVESAPVPETGESTSANGLTFERDDELVYASSNGTEVVVAGRETYD